MLPSLDVKSAQVRSLTVQTTHNYSPQSPLVLPRCPSKTMPSPRTGGRSLIRLGLTGGIGSGKSVVARMFAECGAEVIDADQLARQAVEPGQPAYHAIIERFGTDCLHPDGSLDRKKLGRLIFSDDALRGALNGIVHPQVRELARRRFDDAERRGVALCVYDVPLLFETKLENQFSAIVVVSASDEVRRLRLMHRDQMSSEDIDRRLAAQMPLPDKTSRADYVVDNDGDLSDTRSQVEAIYRALAASEEGAKG
jgi:dephospho-CoA kinase